MTLLDELWDEWTAQCLKRGTRQDGMRWQIDDETTGDGRWVPKMVPKREDRELPSARVCKLLEAEVQRIAAEAGITGSAVRLREIQRRREKL